MHRFSFLLATQEHSLVFPLSSKVSVSSQLGVGVGSTGAGVAVGEETGDGVGLTCGGSVWHVSHVTGQKSLNFLHRFSFFLATQEHSLVFPLLSSKVSGSSQPLAAKVGAGVVGAEVGAGVGTKVGAGEMVGAGVGAQNSIFSNFPKSER